MISWIAASGTIFRRICERFINNFVYKIFKHEITDLVNKKLKKTLNDKPLSQKIRPFLPKNGLYAPLTLPEMTDSLQGRAGMPAEKTGGSQSV